MLIRIYPMCFDRDTDPDKAVIAGEDKRATTFPVTCTLTIRHVLLFFDAFQNDIHVLKDYCTAHDCTCYPIFIVRSPRLSPSRSHQTSFPCSCRLQHFKPVVITSVFCHFSPPAA